MPELPEVETIRSRLAPRLEGRTLERVEIVDARLTRPEPPEAIAQALEGEHILAVGRRGKYLVFEFESGRHLLVHLRMTGNVEHPAQGGLAADPYRRAVVRLDDGSDVAYRDVRRFGTWALLEPGELEDYFASRRLGNEPLARLHDTRLDGIACGPPNAHQGRPPRPACGCRRREHLCRRSPLARADPPSARGRLPRRRRGRAATQSDQGRARDGDLTSGRHAAGLPRSRRAPRPDAGRIQCLRPSRRAVPAMRHSDREDARRRQGHVVLPAVPGARPRLGSRS